MRPRSARWATRSRRQARRRAAVDGTSGRRRAAGKRLDKRFGASTACWPACTASGRPTLARVTAERLRRASGVSRRARRRARRRFTGAAGGAACGDLVRISLARRRRAGGRRRLRRLRLRRDDRRRLGGGGARGGRARARRRARRHAARSPTSSAGSRPASCTPPTWPPTRCTARSGAAARAGAAVALDSRPHARGDERRGGLRGRGAAGRARRARGGRRDARAVGRRGQRRRGVVLLGARRAGRPLASRTGWGCRTSRSTCARSSAPGVVEPFLAEHAGGRDAEPVRALQRPRAARRDARASRERARRRRRSPPATTRA